MKKKNKYYYCFGPNVSKHIHFYAGWVKQARDNDIPLDMITFIAVNNYIKQFRLIKKLKNEFDIIFIPVIPFTRNLAIFLYFLFQALISKKVTVHLRKCELAPFLLLRRVTNKMRVITELEGDCVSEIDYLKGNPYKKGFYDGAIDNLEKQTKLIEKQLKKCDGIFCVTEDLKKTIVSRHNISPKKVEVIPTGVDSNNFRYCEEIRNEKRKELNLEDKNVFIYSGSVRYSWQKISRTIELFKLYNSMVDNSFLILLINQGDWNIAMEFINKHNLSREKYLLTSCDNNEVNKYLNAADVGFILRDYHNMNLRASPGKLGEYAAAGLPIVTTRGASHLVVKMKELGYATVIEDLNDDFEGIEAIENLLEMNVDRNEYSEWGSQFFSNSSYGKRYANALCRF